MRCNGDRSFFFNNEKNQHRHAGAVSLFGHIFRGPPLFRTDVPEPFFSLLYIRDLGRVQGVIYFGVYGYPRAARALPATRHESALRYITRVFCDAYYTLEKEWNIYFNFFLHTGELFGDRWVGQDVWISFGSRARNGVIILVKWEEMSGGYFSLL